MTTVSDVMTGLNTLIDGALESSESATTKLRLHALSTIIGSVGDELVPLLAGKYDVNALLAAIQRVETGITETEGGIYEILKVIHSKSQH
ncbi:hypothetical protein GS501_04825 [Saccharibacter sp. 17.LH.SD]|uniref:hypothetical protein n=1 Tax=Saccharibacter sp. 17.LH.SD TaxID=2689393 RepID=UPI00136C38F6|nr:hypothetical protein [Saccharibacter sp. 17.LH.SD]MXV44370.1 hypothetical protein [Saccharibacter sp. 17.LH.SD]